MSEWPVFACPSCGAILSVEPARAECPQCGASYERRGGIWRFLSPESAARFTPFIAQYRAVRAADGYGSTDPGYYRALPAVSPDDPQADVWRVRTKSYETLLNEVLWPSPSDLLSRRLRRRERGVGLRVCDLGAGNGWLCNRLTELGCRCVAADLLDDDLDGLGAARHYATEFVRVQAEFDRLPFAPGQFDLIVFNAALHHSSDPLAALRRALTGLSPNGFLVVMDSPVYRSRSGGERMRVERQADFQRRYGIEDAVDSGAAYLTVDDLRQWAHALGLPARWVRPFLGWRWAARSLATRLRARREPAMYGVWICQSPKH